MNKTNSVIEVNGNRYDAVTGQLLSAGKKIKKSTQSSGKKMIDGFVLGAHHTKMHTRKASSAMSKVSARPKTVAQGLHRPAEKPKTLIRKGLKKPSLSQGSNSAVPLVGHRKFTDPVKEMRSKTVTLHNQVNRFGNFGRPKNTETPITPKHLITSRPNSAAVKEVSPAMPSMITSLSHKKIERMLDEALMKADAHKHMLNKPHQNKVSSRLSLVPRWISFGFVGFLLAALAAFLVWQNLPAVAVHVAAAKVHVNATMPAYTPTGFSYVQPLQYSPGAVTMQFQDKQDSQKQFSLTQKASNWSSSSLEANALPKEANIQSSEINGTTVYIYGDNKDAMWVNHSVLYSLKNQAKLSSDQVLRIVQGL